MKKKQFITIEDYLQKYYYSVADDEKGKSHERMRNYLRSLTEPCKEAFPPVMYVVGMIQWNNNDAYCWAGPFEGNFCLCHITDHAETYPPPKTISQIDFDQKTDAEYSLYNVPQKAKDRIFPNLQHGFSFAQMSSNGTLCGRTTMTHSEYIQLMNNMTEDEKIQRQAMIDNALNPKKLYSRETVSKEFPIKVFLCGTDDCSYTKLVANREEAQKELDVLLTHGNNFEYIKKNYVFTN